MAARDDTSTWVLALLALYALGKLPKLSDWLPTTSLPTGTRPSEEGELREVPAERTALDPAGFPELFARALADVEGTGLPVLDAPPNEYMQAGKVLAALAAVETDNGRACWHFNVGNLTTTKGDFYRLKGNPLRFARYLSAGEGARAVVSRIKRLWPDAYRSAFLGPAMIDTFARQLSEGGRSYYGNASSASYAAQMTVRARENGWA